MQTITSSASKIVFILLTITICTTFILEVSKGQVTLDSKDFVSLVLMSFTFYFANKGDSTQPFAGK